MWLYGVYRKCAETAAVSRGTSHATTTETALSVHTAPLQWTVETITCYKRIQSRVIQNHIIMRHECDESAPDQRIAPYKSRDQQFNKCNNNNNNSVSRFDLAAVRQVRLSGKQDLGSIPPLRLSFLFKKVVVCGHCFVTLSLTINRRGT